MLIELYLLTHLALLPVFMEEFQLNLFQAAMIATIPSLMSLLMNVPMGLIADRVRTKILLLSSMLIEGLSALLVGQATDVYTLIVGLSLLRVSIPIYHNPGLSAISRFTERRQWSQALGMHNAFGSLGAAFGALSLPILMFLPYGWRSAYLLWPIPVLAWTIPIIKTGIPRGAETEGGGSQKKKPFHFLSILTLGFATFLFIFSLREMAISGISTFMTTYLVDGLQFSWIMATLIFGLGSLVGVAGSLSGGYLGGKMGERRAMTLALLGCLASLLFLASTSSLEWLVITYLIYAFFDSSIWIPVSSLVAHLTPRDRRGVGYSTYFFIQGTIDALSPAIVAQVIGTYGLWYIFPFAILMLASSTIILQFIPIQ
jgi:MFS family permease